jgi:hypothetical protein
MAITRFWGRDAEALFAALPAGTPFYAEREGAWAVKMSGKTLRGIPVAGRCVVSDNCDDDDRLTVTVVVMDHPSMDRPVTIRQEFGIGYPVDSARWMWEEGNYSCDCNRSRFIIGAGTAFPAMECGETIELKQIFVYRENVPWSVKK